MKSVLIIDSNNNVIQQYNIEDWQIQSINLLWNWSKDWNTFTFQDSFNWTNVFYIDWYWKDQKIIANNDLYLNWNLTVWYTWQQYLTFIDESCWVFNWYTPVFDITWWIEDVSTSWNIFNNFAENSVKFTLSNIPSYIQYVIIIMLLFFILGFIRKFKRR